MTKDIAKPPLVNGQRVRGRIETMDDEGRGRFTGAIDVAVRGASVGDDVTAQVERVFAVAGIAQARAIEVHEAGNSRTEHPCPHGRPCAGCPLADVVEPLRHDIKRARIQQALDDEGLTSCIGEMRVALAPRQKVKLVHQHGRLGLFAPHSHDVADAYLCPGHDPAINRALLQLRGRLPEAVHAVIARRFVEGVAIVLVSKNALPADVETRLAALVQTVGDIEADIVSLAIRVDGRDTNSLLGGEVVFRRGPRILTPLEGGPPCEVDAFCQPDPVLARQLVQEVTAAVVATTDDPTATFVDLYAGTGAFARGLLAHGAQQVVAVERARDNTQHIGGERFVMVPRAVEDAHDALLGYRNIQGIVADPPRKGLGDEAAFIAGLGARRIALVACDPDRGARDARAIVDAGYALSAVWPFDLFPLTPDVETVFILDQITASR